MIFSYRKRDDDKDKRTNEKTGNYTQYRQRGADKDKEETAKKVKVKTPKDSEVDKPEGRTFKENKKTGQVAEVECEEGDPDCP